MEREVIGSVSCHSTARLHASWRAGEVITTCELRNQATREHGDRPDLNCVYLSEANQGQRRIAHDTLSHYKELRVFMQNEAPDMSHSDILKKQLDYSITLREVLANPSVRYEGGTLVPPEEVEAEGPAAADSGANIVQHAIWQLLEMFYLQQDVNEGYLPEDLAQWLMINEHAFLTAADADVLELAVDHLLRQPQPWAAQQYWPTVHKLVALGRIDRAWELIMTLPKVRDSADGSGGSSTSPEYEVVEGIMVLVEQFPRHRRPEEQQGQLAGRQVRFSAPGQFVASRRTYQQGCGVALTELQVALAAVRKSDPALANGAVKLMRLLAGEQELLLSLCTNWVEALVALVFHMHMDLQPHDLALLTEAALQKRPPGSDESNVVLQDVAALMRVVGSREVAEVVRVLSGMRTMDLWMMAHVFDVLRGYSRASAIIDRAIPGSGMSQAEYYTLQYATHLLSRQATWQLGCEYLAWCPTQGAAALEAALERLPHLTEDSRTAYKVLHYCQKHGLASVATGVCRQLGMACWSQGRVGDALRWLLQARDEARCTLVVAPLLDKVHAQLLAGAGEYALAELDLPELDDLQALLQSVPGVADEHDSSGGMSRATGLHFLWHLARIQQAVQHLRAHLHRSPSTPAPPTAADSMAAACGAIKSAVLALYSRDLVPPKLRLPLLLYLVPLLESNSLHMSSAEVQQLQQVLLASWLSHQGATWSKGLAARHVQDVQLALARGLARALIEEGTQDGSAAVF